MAPFSFQQEQYEHFRMDFLAPLACRDMVLRYGPSMRFQEWFCDWQVRVNEKMSINKKE